MALRDTGLIDFCEKCEDGGLLIGYAKPSCEAERLNTEKDSKHGYRAAFARDRDRIIYTRAFRRLVHKSQIFVSVNPSKFMTRLTHTLRVTQIAQTISRALKLNEDLSVAVALGHDIGHAPFGHLGEDVLRNRMLDCDGFEHNEESVWMLMRFEGLNLTVETLESILKHTRFDFQPYRSGGITRGDPFGNFWIHGCSREFKDKFKYFGSEGEDGKIDFQQPSSLEGQVVDIADEIAYMAHDLVDLRDMGVVDDRDFPPEWVEKFGQKERQRNMINAFVTAAIDYNSELLASLPDRRNLVVGHPPDFAALSNEIKGWENEIFKTKLNWQVEYVQERIGSLFDYFEKNTDELEKQILYFRLIYDYGYRDNALIGHCIATMTDYEVDNLYYDIKYKKHKTKK